MHLVMVSSLVPVENPSSGFDIANRAVLEGLRALGHRVSVIGYLEPGKRPAGGCDMRLLGQLEVTNARVGKATKLKWLARAFARRTTLSSAKMMAVSPARIEAILKSLAPFDGLILNSIQLSAAFRDIFARYPSIYVAHNIEAQSARENAQTASGLVESLLFQREAHYLEQFESRIATQASHVWTFAEGDRAGFGKAVLSRSSVLPLVTRWQAPVASSGAPTPTHDLGLIGSWSWKPNRAGLDWFLDHVVPRLPADMSIAIAGQITAPPQVPHPGVRFVGRVEDAQAFVSASAVVPLVARAGTGVQLKTIEAFEMGMNCVATTPSLRGIANVPAQCRVVDDPAEFAAALVAAVAQPGAAPARQRSAATFHADQKDRMLAAMETGLSKLQALRGAATSRVTASPVTERNARPTGVLSGTLPTAALSKGGHAQ